MTLAGTPPAATSLYYGDVGYWPGIARIGHISGEIDTIADQQGDFTATIHSLHRLGRSPVARVYRQYTYP